MTYNEYFSLSDLYRNLGHPFPDTIKMHENYLVNIGALDLSHKNIRKKFPEQFWQKAVLFDINLFPEDLKYINDVIKTDRIFNLINFDVNWEELDNNQKYDILVKRVLCYEYFYNDKKCPKQFKRVLYVLLGTYKEKILEYTPNYRHNLIGLWFDYTR
jgi:hypothetical protein